MHVVNNKFWRLETIIQEIFFFSFQTKAFLHISLYLYFLFSSIYFVAKLKRKSVLNKCEKLCKLLYRALDVCESNVLEGLSRTLRTLASGAFG